MQTYEVTLQRTVVQHATITVQETSEANANRVAAEVYGPIWTDWEDTKSTTPSPVSIYEVNPSDEDHIL